MPHLITVTVELDTEYLSEAQRVSHVIAGSLLDQDWVAGVAVEPPVLGSLGLDEAW